MSDSLQPHGLQHARFACPLLSPRVAQIHVHCVDDVIQPSLPLLPLFLLTSILPSIRVFSSELALSIRWPKYWSFSFSISPSNSELISFRIDWLDLCVVQGILRSFLQHRSSKASILWRSAFFMVQLSYSYMTTGKHSFDYTDLSRQSDVSAF